MIDAAKSGIPQIDATTLLNSALNTTYLVAGIVAVIIIIISGFNYVNSAGDAAKVTKAKNMILYSVIGLVVVILAFTITAFVTSRV